MLRQAFTTTLGDKRSSFGGVALRPAEIFFGRTVDRALKPYSQSYLKSIFSTGMEWGIAP